MFTGTRGSPGPPEFSSKQALNVFELITSSPPSLRENVKSDFLKVTTSVLVAYALITCSGTKSASNEKIILFIINRIAL